MTQWADTDSCLSANDHSSVIPVIWPLKGWGEMFKGNSTLKNNGFPLEACGNDTMGRHGLGHQFGNRNGGWSEDEILVSIGHTAHEHLLQMGFPGKEENITTQ